MQDIDQKQMWNEKHARGEHATYIDKPMKFAVGAEKDFPPKSSVLELGCGTGSDARYFSKKGHSVEATDFSSVVIMQNNERLHQGVHFSFMDMSQVFPYENAVFDVVYAHLSIHYFTDEITKKIISEIGRVLKPFGRFYFRCKATDSWEKGISTEVAPNIFVANETGHIRHLFSEEYTREILRDAFTVEKLQKTRESYKGTISTFMS